MAVIDTLLAELEQEAGATRRASITAGVVVPERWSRRGQAWRPAPRFLCAPGWRFHAVGAKRQREQIRATERAESLACCGIGLDGGAKIVGNRRFVRAAHGSVRRVPAAIRLGSIDLPLAVWRHAPGRGEPRDMIAIDLAPDTSRLPRRVALEKRLSSNALRMPSIHPQHRATSRACAIATDARPEPFCESSTRSRSREHGSLPSMRRTPLRCESLDPPRIRNDWCHRTPRRAERIVHVLLYRPDCQTPDARESVP